MKYEEMSDFEINKKICDLFWPDLSKSNICRNKNFEQGGAAVYIKNGYGGFSRDYCNSWADAGPLIEKHGISIYRIDENDNPFIKDEEVIGLWFSCGPMADGYGDPEPIKDGLSCSNKKPLRAAMTSFLMMQEGK